jgi:hypothetical protein
MEFRKMKFAKTLTEKNNDSVLYEAWFRSVLKEYYKTNALQSRMAFDKFIESCCFFFTMTFSTHLIQRQKERLSLGNDDHSVEFDNFTHLYNQICRSIFGAGFYRIALMSKLPMAFVAIDASRNQLNPNPNNIHIQGVWIWHPDEVDAFNKLRTTWKYRLRILNGLYADQIHFEPLNAIRMFRSQTGSYFMKSFIGQKQTGTGSNDIRIYPANRNGETSYKTIHLYPKFNRVIERMRIDYNKMLSAKRMPWDEKLEDAELTEAFFDK